MSGAGFTPGPWFVDEDNRPGMEWNRHICAGEQDRICFMSNDGGAPSGEANARLIAAAPELYEALEALCDSIEREEELNRSLSGVLVSDMRVCRAALAKARGETA